MKTKKLKKLTFLFTCRSDVLYRVRHFPFYFFFRCHFIKKNNLSLKTLKFVHFFVEENCHIYNISLDEMR